LGIKGAGHGFDALLPRTLSSVPFSKTSAKVMGSRYTSGMINVEQFVRHWLSEGSAVTAAKDNRRSSERLRSSNTGGEEMQGRAMSGARIKLPRGGPRL
jgi:hypothetical protein